MAEASGDILRILCIHGYRQNAQAFRERTGAFRKIVKKHAELIFITAPNVVPPMEAAGSEGGDGDSKNADQRGWWFSRQDDYFKAQDESACCKGYDESLQVITTALKEQGPFDGVLGFSQGASMVSLLCGLLEQQGKRCPFQYDFAILIAGFRSRSSTHDSLYSGKVALPTLHVLGDTDKVIEKEMSEDLLQYFLDPHVLTHPGGHFIPAAGPQKKVYLTFIKAMMERKTQRAAKS